MPLRRQDAFGVVEERSRTLALLLVASLLVGAGLRLWDFAGGRSLWHDEAMVSISLVYLPFPALMGELPFDQIAPVGWLIVERLGFLVWPDLDYGLRLLSIIGGLLALLAHWRLSRAALPAPETVLSVGLFAFASELIRYSAMVKPYIWDAVFSAVILALGVRLLRSEGDRTRLTVALALAGLACIALSFGGLTVLASTGLVLFARALWSGDRRWAAALAGVGLLWVASLGLLYLFDYARQDTTVGNMVGLYWGERFAPAPISARALAWYYHAPASVFGFLLQGVPAASILVGVAVGALAMSRRRPWLGALLVGPMLVAVLASAARAYPFDTRFQLALAPPLILLLCHAVGTIARSTPRPALAAAALGLPLVAAPAIATARQALRAPPWAFEEVEPNLARLARQASRRDVVLVTPAAERPLLLYAAKFGLHGLRYAVTADHRGDARCASLGLDVLPGAGRAWLLTYHEGEPSPMSTAMLAALGRRGEVAAVGRERASALYRVDLRRRVPEPAMPPACRKPRKSPELLVRIALREGLAPPRAATGGLSAPD